ncbi:MAG TPA: VWA domain-containing protein [Verrucomicrobiae bacterium]|jgi:Ca-activated chloride channel family protein|nr:VWA domain-containing protein [Verrucomicrobiae bacterium]
MRFAQPQVLWLLLVVVPALIGFLFWSWRVKQKLILQFVHSRLLSSLTVGVSAGRQKLRLALLVAAVAGVLLALARPQWGFAWEEARFQGLDIIVALDTSRSMLAKDAVPDRLDKAKYAAIDLMRLAKSDRLGLVAFAGTGFLQAPLTVDDHAFAQALNAVSVGVIPQGGTSLSAAIKTTMSAFEKGNDNHKVMVLFTDGEDHDADTETLDAAKEAADAGIRIFTIGVGTPEGELLQATDDQGNTAFIKDENGDVVKSRLNQTLLQKIATTANGFYLPLQGADPMNTLYQRGIAPLPKSEESTRLTRVYQERYYWPLGFAIVCLLAELLLPESPRQRRVAIALVLLLLSKPAFASPSSAYKDYQTGDYKGAFDEYYRLAEKKTNDYRLRFDAGTSAYQAKEFEKAEKGFTEALNSPGIISAPAIQQHTYYDLGNTLYHIGTSQQQPDGKQKYWEQAVEDYTRAIHLDTNDVDAQNNLQFVKQQLEKLKQDQKDKKPPDDQEPDEAAKKAKARADEAVRQRLYKEAMDIMETSRKQDPTTEYYADYIKRLEEINGVATNAAH